MASDRPQNLFRSLDAKASSEIYPKLRKNADRHFKAAELLNKSGDSSNAIAHLILGSEELVKSFVLVLQAHDFPVKKIASYDKLFTHHVARHNLLKEFYSMYSFIAGVIARPRWNKERSTLENVTKVILYGLNILNHSIQNHAWWNEADKLKQNCFYLDYTTNGIADPAIFDQAGFNTADNFSQKFRKDLRLMTVIIEKATPEDIAELKTVFIDTGLIEQIDESITRKKCIV